ncbi:MAG: hypothetical protein JW706_01680 [Opitutales bacterium]|nr:hypothetical protein [Opitutales bacterium]
MIEHSTAGKNRANPKSGFCIRWTQQLLIASALGIILSAGSLRGDVRDADGSPVFFQEGKRLMTRYEVGRKGTGVASGNHDECQWVVRVDPKQAWDVQGDDLLDYRRLSESHSVILTRDGLAWGDDTEYCDWVGDQWSQPWQQPYAIENMGHRPFGKKGDARGQPGGLLLMDHVSRVFPSDHYSTLLLRSDGTLWLASSLVDGASGEGLYLIGSDVVEATGGVADVQDPTRNFVWYLNSKGELWLDTIRDLPDTKVADNVDAIGGNRSVLALLSNGEVWEYQCEVSEDFRVGISQEKWLGLPEFGLEPTDEGFVSTLSGNLSVQGDLMLVGSKSTGEPILMPLEGSGGVVQATTLEEQIIYVFGMAKSIPDVRYGKLYLREDGIVRYYDYLFGTTVTVAHGIQQLSNGSIVRPYSGIPIYRFSNTGTGSHFFCLSHSEAVDVVNTPGWEWEGFAFGVPMESDAGSQPVYRMYNKASGVHFYTMSVEERDNLLATRGDTFQLEGVAFHAFGHQADGTLPVYRFYAPQTQSHFFTISEAEKDWIVANVSANDLVLDGIAWYCWPW